jgi:hypothetical protein
MLTDLWRARYEIEQFMCRAQQWQCVRDGVPLNSLDGGHVSISFEFGKLIFSFWGDDFAESWRIDDYRITSDRLLLELSRQMGRQCLQLELRPHNDAEALPTDSGDRRRRFQQILCQIITHIYPGAVISRIATQRDDARQLSGIYTRMIVTVGREQIIAIGVNAQESQCDIDGLLTAAIIWFDRAGIRLDAKPKRLLLFSPAGQPATMARRLTAIRPPGDVTIELYEVDERSVAAHFVRPFDQGSLFDLSRHRLPRTPEPESINPLRDQLLERHPDLKVYRRPGQTVESLRLRGLEVARVSGGKVWFGVGASKQILDGNDLTPFTQFIQEVAQIRRAESERKWHALYRQQAERWLEDMIRQNLRALDVNLNPRYIYPQTPAHRDDEYGVVDLLAMTEGGRLVVIELKVAEDMELPLQGLDYWLQVEWHRQRGDFQRRGYFSGARLADESALLFLASPLLRFHRTFDLVARWIDRRVPAYKVGINDNWREGVKVLVKERVHG